MVFGREAGTCVGQCKDQEVELSLFVQGMAATGLSKHRGPRVGWDQWSRRGPISATYNVRLRS